MSPSLIGHRVRRVCGVLIPFLFAAQLARAVPPPAGIAPVSPPVGGFALDGDVTANTPANVGDWIVCPTPPGTGGGVLDKNGAPLNPATTLHVIDAFGNSGSDQIFGGGLKWFDDPNTWRWTMGKCSSKTDINNALLHVTADAEGHLWALVSGDRLSTSGDSYIDFEFLQNTLIRRADGSFLSSGPHGGRTTNDLLLSLAFTGGGKTADFFAWQWQPLAGGGFGYVDITTNLPNGRVYVALNADTTPVPYGAFGKTSYDRNAFVEGAVDLTALLSNFDPCMALVVKTVMVKTKASQSTTATIEDFIDPIQFSLTIGPSANAGPDQTRCWEGASTTFALQGQATAGIRPIASLAWSVVSGSATLDGDHTLTPVAHVSSASATLRLTVLEQNGCTVTDDVTLNVTPLPPCLISGPATDLCPGSATVFTGPPGLATYAWTITGNGMITGPTNGPSVTVLAGGLCESAFQLQLAAGANGCASSCSSQFMVNDTTAPTLVLPPHVELECPADTGTNRTGVAAAQDGCGQVSVSFHDDTTPLCGGSVTIARTWMAQDSCGNRTSAVQVITLRDRTPPVLTMPPDLVLTCPAQTEPAATGTATARDACSQVSVQHTDDVSRPCGGAMVILRTWTATDACGNTASAVQKITVEDRTAPAMVLPLDRVLECPANLNTNATGVPSAVDGCGGVTVRYTDVTTNQCGGSKVVRRTWTVVDECGNSTNAVQTLTVRDTTAPTVVAPRDLVLDCPANTGTNATGVATVQDGCSQATLTFTDDMSNRCGGTMVITRTWTATDACGNTASAVQMITVQDRTPPVVTAPPNVVLECPAVPTTNFTGVATARDLCGGVALAYRDVITNQCGGTFLIKRTWTATDDCGNSASVLQTITVRDTTPPVLTIPPSLVLECPADIQPSATGTATAEDTCGQPTVRYTDAVTPVCGGAKTIRRTWTATDACGNTTSAVQTLTVRDTRPPTIVGPPDRLLECGDDTRPSATGFATAQDGCSQATVSYSDVASNLCAGSKDITRTWTATDGCGNNVSVVQRIVVRDTRPPAVQCSLVCTYSQGGYGGSGEPAAILEANYLAQFPNGVMLGILDAASGNASPNGLFWQPNAAGLAAVRNFLSGGGGSSGVLGRDAVNPTDDFGGGELAHQALTLTINIRFNESGVIGVGPNNFGSLVYTQPNDSLSGLTVNQILLAANRALAGQDLPAGYSYSDLTDLLDTLNHSFHEYSISGWSLAHLDAPALSVQCASSVPAPDPGHVSASDDCSGVANIFLLSDVISDYLCANHYTITRTWGARDACGNVGTCSFRILVNDTTPPVMTGNAALSIPGGQAWDFQVPIASDNCGSVALREFSTVTNLVSDVLLVATRAWEAKDECANTSYFQQTVTVGGTAAPAGTAGTPVVDSTFETGDDGWRITDGTTDQSPVVLPTGGQAGAYVKPGNGAANSNGRFWSAPAKYRGGRLPFYGGFFSFACRPSGAGAPTTLRLVGAGLVLSLDLPAPAGTNWVTCTVRLHESAGWRNAAANRPATQAELIMVLSSLTNLLLGLDVASDGTAGGLDNVALITPVTAPNSGWILEVQHRGSGIRIRWPSLANGHRLEQADSLFSPTWTPVSATPSVVTGLNQVDLAPGVGAKFFRLRKP